MVAFLEGAVAKTLGRSESPLRTAQPSLSSSAIAVSSRDLNSASTPFRHADKKRLAAPQKTIYNRNSEDGTREAGNAFFSFYGLIFHFGWSDVVSGR
jgi:hypothetical protein